MLNFFAIIVIIFIVFLLLVFNKRKFKNTINIKNLSTQKPFNNRINNNKYITKKNRYSYNHHHKRYSNFDKRALKNEMVKLFQSNTQDKLKALKIAEQLADKSTLPILRKGLRDTSPAVVKISATLIRNFR